MQKSLSTASFRSGGSRVGGSILCSQFQIGTVSLVADPAAGIVSSQASSKNLFASAQDMNSSGSLISKSQVQGKQSEVRASKVERNNTIGEEGSD